MSDAPLNERPFRDTLHDLAVQRGLVTGMGNVNWALLAKELPTIHYETLRKLLAGERHLDKPALEEIAAAVGADPCVFVEYRLMKAQERFDASVVGTEQALANLREYLAFSPPPKRARGSARAARPHSA